MFLSSSSASLSSLGPQYGSYSVLSTVLISVLNTVLLSVLSTVLLSVLSTVLLSVLSTVLLSVLSTVLLSVLSTVLLSVLSTVLISVLSTVLLSVLSTVLLSVLSTVVLCPQYGSSLGPQYGSSLGPQYGSNLGPQYGSYIVSSVRVSSLYLHYGFTVSLCSLSLARVHGQSVLSVLSTGTWSVCTLCPQYGFMVSLAVAGLLCTMLPRMKTFQGLVAFSCGFGFCGGCFIALIAVILVDFLGKERLASSFGLASVAMAVGIMAGPAIYGQ